MIIDRDRAKAFLTDFMQEHYGANSFELIETTKILNIEHASVLSQPEYYLDYIVLNYASPQTGDIYVDYGDGSPLEKFTIGTARTDQYGTIFDNDTQYPSFYFSKQIKIIIAVPNTVSWWPNQRKRPELYYGELQGKLSNDSFEINNHTVYTSLFNRDRKLIAYNELSYGNNLRLFNFINGYKHPINDSQLNYIFHGYRIVFNSRQESLYAPLVQGV